MLHAGDCFATLQQPCQVCSRQVGEVVPNDSPRLRVKQKQEEEDVEGTLEEKVQAGGAPWTNTGSVCSEGMGVSG